MFLHKKKMCLVQRDTLRPMQDGYFLLHTTESLALYRKAFRLVREARLLLGGGYLVLVRGHLSPLQGQSSLVAPGEHFLLAEEGSCPREGASPCKENMISQMAREYSSTFQQRCPSIAQPTCGCAGAWTKRRSCCGCCCTLTLAVAVLGKLGCLC